MNLHNIAMREYTLHHYTMLKDRKLIFRIEEEVGRTANIFHLSQIKVISSFFLSAAFYVKYVLINAIVPNLLFSEIMAWDVHVIVGLHLFEVLISFESSVDLHTLLRSSPSCFSNRIINWEIEITFPNRTIG